MTILASLQQVAERLEAYARAAAKVREAYEEIRKLEESNGKSPIPDNLTHREAEIYVLIGEGMTMRDIASKLGRSLKTIEAQRDTLRKKLGFATAHDLMQSIRRK